MNEYRLILLFFKKVNEEVAGAPKSVGELVWW